MTVQLTTLPSGLRVVTDTVPTVDTVAVGVWAAVGTRDEDMRHNGIAHMVEHMMFKGTPTRSAQQIAEEIENVGGHMNAYTSREITSYHIHLLKDDLRLAMEVLADILQNPTLPEDEIERERQVILQEIGMTADTPDDLVFDLYQETAYPGQAIGAPILGTAEIISAMGRSPVEDYIKRFYTPGRLVISAAGNLSHEDVVAMAGGLFSGLPADTDAPRAGADYRGGERREEKSLEQSHLVMGFRGVSRNDSAYHAAMTLDTVLGGGMSSRLFQEIREKRGLVYNIFAHHSAYNDDGQFVIYAGTGPENLGELIPLICEEIGKAAQDVTEEEIVRAKAQRRSSLLLGRESMMSRADRQAKYLINKGHIPETVDSLAKIDAVTRDDVLATARRIFSTAPTVAALGPLGGLESYEGIARRLAA